MDTNLLLVIVISLLSLNLILVGTYIVLVLKEVRETVKKANHLLDTTNEMADAVSKPVVHVSGALDAMTTGLSAFNFVKGLKRRRSSVSSIMDDEEGG